MSQLIPTYDFQKDQGLIQAVNARELHAFLEVGKDFTNWIKGRIRQYGFTEIQDYVLVFAKTGENPKGGRPAKDYYITLDMAKELSMVERNEKGKQARQYFIECERIAKTAKQPDLNNIDTLSQLLLDNLEHRRRLESQVAVLQPRAEIVDRIAVAQGSLCLREAAKVMQMPPAKFNKHLKDRGWIFKQARSSPWQGYSEKVKSGLLEHKITRSETGKAYSQVRVTPKGVTEIAGKLETV